jgi:hypothetical protein
MTDAMEMKELLRRLLTAVQGIGDELRQRGNASSEATALKTEWREVACVLDRTLLVVFFVITIITSVAIFARVM